MFTSEILIAFITGVLGPVLLLVIKNIIDKRNSPKPDMVLDALKVGKLVESKIEDIKDEFKPDRVWITQFHNGGHFYPTGKSIAKFSVMYETVGTGVSSIQQNFQNIPVNLFSKSMNQLVSNETIEIPDYKDETIATYGLKYIAQDTGCKSGYLFTIRTIDDKFIGVLGLDYTKRKTKLDDDVINSLIVYSSSLGGVLMNGEL
tara:strand:+ start:1083 stop:1691 length:609 start_codon:yes stop_codon:yes gene_type:complete